MKSLLGKLALILLFMTLLVFYSIAKAAEEEEWIPLESKGKWGFKDKKGNVTIKPQFGEPSYFSEGLSAVNIEDKFGFINKFGLYVISPRFNYAKNFNEGLAPVKVGYKWGFIDKTGKYVVDLQFDDADIFGEGLAPVKLNEKWGYINKSGNISIPLLYDGASYFTYMGLASVKIGDKWGFINKKGDMVIEPKFGSILGSLPPFFYQGKAHVKIWEINEFIDVRGEILSPDWEFSVLSADHTVFLYYNKKNLSFPTKNIVRVWIKVIDINREYSVRLVEIDCFNMRSRSLSINKYDKEGKAIFSNSYDLDQSKWDYIVPDSVMYGHAKNICLKQSK